MTKLNTKKIVLFALLGATWGVVEAQLGTLLHSAGIPFVGSFMIAISLMFLVTAKYITGFRASSVALALNASLIKFLFTGGIGLFPIVGILIQAAVFDLIIGKKNERVGGYILGGTAIVTYSLFHPFLTQGVLGGMKILQVYARLITVGAGLFNMENQLGIIVLLVLVFAHGLIGALASYFWFTVIVKLEARGLLNKVISSPT